MGTATTSTERSRWWRSADGAVEAMRADFRSHTFPLHIHGTYSFGITDGGAQAFRCRGEGHVSAAGLVMAFNPDDPHDGHAADLGGYRYRMLHIAESAVRGALGGDGAVPLPLFAEPVLDAPRLGRALARLHAAVEGGADRLVVDERVVAAVRGMVSGAATRAAPGVPRQAAGPGDAVAARARAVLEERWAEDLAPEELARLAGAGSRFALYRAFRGRYGMAPSEFRRDLRLRRARGLLRGRDGMPLVDVAAVTGFADQAHLTRWFTRVYGVTPGEYRAARGGPSSPP
ncbi:AraC family transcriptional regulator [Mangrovactinospora gilvigrisea]|nr:AraC family transcriptional regulator [Mangrovactinospora gilvigrisea]